jgi:acetylserotonin N-methyltransferase
MAPPAPPPGVSPHLFQLWQMMSGFKLNMVLNTAVKLGVFDLLAAKGPMTIEQIGDSLPEPVPAPYNGLSRTLKFVAFIELLSFNDGVFDLTPLSKKFLLSSSPGSFVASILLNNDVTYDLVGGLQASVTSGSSVWAAQKGESSEDQYKNQYKDDACIHRLLKSMDDSASYWASSAVTAFDLSSFKTVVDIGGGTGSVSSAAVAAYPGMSATVVDLPAAIVVAKVEFPSSSVFVGADMLTEADLIPSADLVILSRVISDWDPATVKTILDTAFSKLKSGGAVLVCEGLLNEEGTGPVEVLMLDMASMVSSKGKQRSVTQYTELLTASGFTSVTSKGPFYNGIGGLLAVKA